MKKLISVFVIMILALGIFFLYSVLSPNAIPSQLKQAFQEKMEKHSHAIPHQDYAIIIDYQKPIFARRLWLLDLTKDSVLLNTHVTHAWKSGFIYADSFSNIPGSYYSCTGSFISQEDYIGNFGKSMKIHGLEKQNNNARGRAIVFHPMRSYKEILGLEMPDFVKIYSHGCFATIEEEMHRIVSKMKDGRFVYVRS